MSEDDRLSEYYKSKAMDINEAKRIVAEILNVLPDDISNIEVLKKGFTNTSFVFEYKSEKYIMRVPGNGTEKIINRYEEADVYNALKGKNISEEIIYIDGKTGYKIAKFYENSRTVDPNNIDDVIRSMKKLKEFHDLKLTVNHEFDIFDKINFYERMWEGKKSKRENYEEVKCKVWELKSIIEKNTINKSLCHIDSLADNFLLVGDKTILIDWEYAGMQDPHVDIAMFAIYAMYDKEKIDFLIDTYFDGKCTKENRIKIYCYVAACGFLWNNWAEYKINLGEELNEYAISQYKYAEQFYDVVKKAESGE